MIIYQVDSFTDRVFKGNPAGVMILDSEIDTDLMQSIANEMNLSETAFVMPHEEGFKIRYFTPTVEVPICGHATLASAHILYTQGFVEKDSEILFNAKLDDLVVSFNNDWIKMSFPRFKIKQVKSPDLLNLAIGLDVSEFYVDSENGWNLAYIDKESNIKDLILDFEKMKLAIPELLIVTSDDKNGEFDFFS